MRLSTRQSKKIITIIISAILMTPKFLHAQQTDEVCSDLSTAMTCPIPTTNASVTDYLKCVAQFTRCSLFKLDQLPNYISSMIADAADDKGNLQQDFQDVTTNFTNLSNQVIKDEDNQLKQIPTVIQPYAFVSPFTGKQMSLPSPNDLYYPTLKGQFFVQPDPKDKQDHALNYIVNASGFSIGHVQPGETKAGDWNGGKLNIGKYTMFFNTVNALQTYNAYAMSRIYSDFLSGEKLSQLQNTLISQANGSDWYTQVATENMGIVFRQLLLYNSQIYVMLIRQWDTQKQILTAQTMANSLAILNSMQTEDTLFRNALGTK